MQSDSCRIVARVGVGWVTMSGDPIDHVLDICAPLLIAGPGRLVIEAVGGVNLQFEIEMSPENK